jgi:hypothetical protein
VSATADNYAASADAENVRETSGTSHHRQFDTQRLLSKNTARMGDEGKAVGRRRRLCCFEQRSSGCEF